MIWVLDTSSLSEVRRIETVGKTDERRVFERLTRLVEEGVLIYPVQVVNELKARRGKDERFLPYQCATEQRHRATRYGPSIDELSMVMRHPQAKRVVDPDKAMGEEEADPYVLALALRAKSVSPDVTVVSEERRDNPRKLSINTACGLLRIYCLPMRAFLVERGILRAS